MREREREVLGSMDQSGGGLDKQAQELVLAFLCLVSWNRSLYRNRRGICTLCSTCRPCLLAWSGLNIPVSL